MNLDESMVTLNFAQTVKSIKVAARRVAKIDKDALIKSLSEELQSLKEQIKNGTATEGQDLHSQAELIRNMMESYKARWEEAKQTADLLRQNLAISRWRFAKASVKHELRDDEKPNEASGQEASDRVQTTHTDKATANDAKDAQNTKSAQQASGLGGVEASVGSVRSLPATHPSNASHWCTPKDSFLASKAVFEHRACILGCPVVITLIPFLGGLGSLINPFKQKRAPFLSLGYWAA